MHDAYREQLNDILLRFVSNRPQQSHGETNYLLTIASTLAHDKVFDKVDLFSVEINMIVVHQILQHHLGALLMCPVRSGYSAGNEFVVKDVTERTMTYQLSRRSETLVNLMHDGIDPLLSHCLSWSK